MSTGNDIVALALTDKDRTSRYRFHSRILSPRELELFDPVAGSAIHHPGGSSNHDSAALTFHQFIWLMWSIKESAYKYGSRANPALVFAPLKIPVTQLTIREDFFEGAVFFGDIWL
jgi:phosphopantetheinyl transferase (holo-ACP synthase)